MASGQTLQYTLGLRNQFSQTMAGAVQQTTRMDSAMNKLRSTASKVGGVIAGAFSIGTVVNFGKAVLESLKNYEYFTAAIRTMLGGDKLAAQALQFELVNLAKTTPFQLTEVQDASKQLLAYGFKAGDLVNTMKTLGDVSSGVGAPLTDIAYLYGTLKTSGRVMQVDLRQFAGRGIPIYESLAKVLGKTTKEINGLVHDGKIGFKDVENAFKLMTKEGGQFFNLMTEQSQTVGGKISNLGDVWDQLKVNIGRSQKGIIASTIDFFSETLNGFNDFMIKANSMEESFKKFGAKGNSFADRALATVGAGGGLGGGMTALDTYKFQLDKLNESDYSAKLKIFQLTKEMKRLDQERLSGKISPDNYLSKAALISGTLDEIRGKAKLSTMKEGTGLGKDTGAKSTESGSTSINSGTEVTGARPQNLTINVTKLVETLNINTTNIKEGIGQMTDGVKKALLELLNDANQTAFQ